MDFLRDILSRRDFEIPVPGAGTMPPRCNYVPGGVAEKISLNGKWDFLFAESCADFGFDTADSVETKKINVPGGWQSQGYDTNQYVNIHYPIPFCPPYVPVNTPLGYYRKEIVFNLKKNCRYFANFEGVSSFYYLFVNRKLVGFYSTAHLRGEFDITAYLRDGVNVLEVVVLKWSFATYFEDQDKFRINGIFRDAYILVRPKNCLWDFRISSVVSDDLKNAEIAVDFSGNDIVKKVTLKEGGHIIGRAKTKGRICFQAKGVKLWSAEDPALYDICIECNGEIISVKYAVRRLEIQNGVVMLNGKPLKIHGVNRHEAAYPEGKYVSREQTEKDIQIIKGMNANAVRASHYPNSSFFYELCDQYGLYVIDEADIETHGALQADGNTDWLTLNWNNYKIFTEDKLYEPVFRQRIRGMLAQNFNYGCILIWSLGNESGWGKNFSNEAHYIRSQDKSRLIHYENLHKSGGGRENDSNALDLVSEMYYMPQKMKELLADPAEKRPYFLCEYSHAMGNSCGDLADYEELFRSEKRMLGGCVWEFADHAVSDKRGLPLFGGESGEKPNDGSFCVDGFLDYNRKEKSGALFFKSIYCPVKITRENGKFFIENRYVFSELKQKVDAFVRIYSENGVKQKKISLPKLSAGEKAELSFEAVEARSVYFYYKEKQSGRELGYDHFVIKNPQRQSLCGERQSFCKEGEYFSVKACGKKWYIDKTNALVGRIEGKNGEILVAPSAWNISRAYLDNDVFYKNCGYDFTESKTEVRNIELTDEGLVAEVWLQNVSLFNPVEINVLYKAQEDGLLMRAKVKISDSVERLPRFGIRMFLDKKMDKVRYYGYGPHESYIDKLSHTYREYFDFNVRKVTCPYLKPQEFGSHYKTQSLRVSGWDDISVEGEFSFSALAYSQEQLSSKNHNYELKKENRTVLCVDYAMEGVGSCSCGTVLDKKYSFTEKEFVFELLFK